MEYILRRRKQQNWIDYNVKEFTCGKIENWKLRQGIYLIEMHKHFLYLDASTFIIEVSSRVYVVWRRMQYIMLLCHSHFSCLCYSL